MALSEPFSFADACGQDCTSVFVQLREMRESDPSAKALVFSQFVGTIEWLKGKLREHGFGYRTISGSMPQKQRAKVVTVHQSSMLTLKEKEMEKGEQTTHFGVNFMTSQGLY